MFDYSHCFPGCVLLGTCKLTFGLQSAVLYLTHVQMLNCRLAATCFMECKLIICSSCVSVGVWCLVIRALPSIS